MTDAVVVTARTDPMDDPAAGEKDAEPRAGRAELEAVVAARVPAAAARAPVARRVTEAAANAGAGLAKRPATLPASVAARTRDPVLRAAMAAIAPPTGVEQPDPRRSRRSRWSTTT